MPGPLPAMEMMACIAGPKATGMTAEMASITAAMSRMLPAAVPPAVIGVGIPAAVARVLPGAGAMLPAVTGVGVTATAEVPGMSVSVAEALCLPGRHRAVLGKPTAPGPKAELLPLPGRHGTAPGEPGILRSKAELRSLPRRHAALREPGIAAAIAAALPEGLRSTAPRGIERLARFGAAARSSLGRRRNLGRIRRPYPNRRADRILRGLGPAYPRDHRNLGPFRRPCPATARTESLSAAAESLSFAKTAKTTSAAETAPAPTAETLPRSAHAGAGLTALARPKLLYGLGKRFER